MKKIALIYGTRPEAIKMAPIYLALRDSKNFEPIIIITAQHREMLDQVNRFFNIEVGYDLNVMTERQSLSALTSKIISRLDEVLSKERIDFTLVQGDTTSTFAGALSSFYHHVPVGHVEAGLRTYDMNNPFPEEANRKLTATLANFHFAPTQRARRNLIKENIPSDIVEVTGNTVVDALKWIIANKRKSLEREIKKFSLSKQDKFILLTMHRRENWGVPMQNALRGLKRILKIHPEYKIIFPVHLNPTVKEIAFNELGKDANTILTAPVSYITLVSLLEKCDFVLTDSGGIQEEAPVFGKPCLVLRKTTERPEAVEAGVSKIIGTDTKVVFENTLKLIEDREEYQKMSHAISPFGDGHASEKILNILEQL